MWNLARVQRSYGKAERSCGRVEELRGFGRGLDRSFGRVAEDFWKDFLGGVLGELRGVEEIGEPRRNRGGNAGVLDSSSADRLQMDLLTSPNRAQSR